MSVQAGWYDDGSGRQRWWDGERWTDHFAPEHQGVAQVPSPQPQGGHVYAAPMASVPPESQRSQPILGYLGLGLAVLGTILACIPATFIFGVILLIAGFVVSLIGVFNAKAAKWPSIAGILLSVLGGVIGTAVTLAIIAASLAGPTSPSDTTGAPPTTSTESPTEPPTEETTEPPTGGATSQRPSPEEMAPRLEALAKEGGVVGYEEDPDFYPCMAQHLYESDVSDESLQLIIDGNDPLDAEREMAGDLIAEAGSSCLS